MTNTLHWDLLYTNINIACLSADSPGYGEIENAALAIKNSKIAWFGGKAELNKLNYQVEKIIDGENGWITPGLIDCHTHLIFAGNRANEFALRIAGKSYIEIAHEGGGILSTVQATQAAEEEALYQLVVPRVKNCLANGVTTVEIKSGYGLDEATETKMLRVAKRVAENFNIRVIKTYLGPHVVPRAFKNNKKDYIESCCQSLKKLKQLDLVDAVDAFCESIAFTAQELEPYFRCAQELGLPIKCHADQLTDSGGVELAVNYQALSVDHLEYLSSHSLNLLAESETVAVLLPGAYYFLNEQQAPPVAQLREKNIPMAIATDFNPGSSPLCSLLVAANMACVLFKLTPAEALKGITSNAAQALGICEQVGSIEVGKAAELCLWNINHPDELTYFLGQVPLAERICCIK